MLSQTLSSTRKVTNEVSFHYRTSLRLHSTCHSCFFVLHVLQIISDTKANADARVRDSEQRALTKAKQAK